MKRDVKTKIVVWAHVIESAEDLLEASHMFLGRLSQRCADAATRVEDAREDGDRASGSAKEKEIGEVILLLCELRQALHFTSLALENEKDHLCDVRTELTEKERIKG